MKQRLIFLTKIVGLSVILYLIGDLLFFGYNRVLFQLYRIFRPLSWPEFMHGYNSALRTIPFLTLLLATPGIPWKRRVIWLAAGLLIFMAIDMISTTIWGGPPSRERVMATSQAHYTGSLIWDMSGHWLLPLLLWLMAAHKQVRGMLVGEIALTPLELKAESGNPDK